MDFAFTEEQQAFRETARQFADKELAPFAADWDLHGTFPKDSELAQRAQSTTNGYHAILAVLSNTHPTFIDKPITLAMNWQKQRDLQSIFNFHTDFMDYICLCAIFMGGSINMTSSNMVNCFIYNCCHSTYLLQISRFDRQDPRKTGEF